MLMGQASEPRAVIRVQEYRVFGGTNPDALTDWGMWPGYVFLLATNERCFYQLREASNNPPSIVKRNL